MPAATAPPDRRAALAAEARDRLAARNDLYAFMRRLYRRQTTASRAVSLSPLPDDAYAPQDRWSEAVASGAWCDGRHLRLLCDAVHRAMRRGGRLIVEMPPRHGKSQTISRALPLFALGRVSHAEVIVSTYGQELSNSFGRWIKASLKNPLFTSVFPRFALESGSSAVDRMETTESGGLAYVGSGGAITGRGARLAIIDDPIKSWEEAQSETMREKLWDWYQSVLRTRLTPDGSIIVLHTRWHPDDLIGRLLEAQDSGAGERWERISLPAIAETYEAHTLSDGGIWVRKPGDALWPERYGADVLAAIRKSVKEDVWGALFQQRPQQLTGSYFNLDLVRVVSEKELPWHYKEEASFYVAWDLAVKGENLDRGDWSAGVVVCRDSTDRIYLVDIVRGRWGPVDLVNEMVNLVKKWKPVAAWVEDRDWKGLAPWVQERIRQTEGCVPYSPLQPVKDKPTRAVPVRALVENRQLCVLGSLEHWPTLRGEMQQFPIEKHGVHDDIVDALAYVCAQSAGMRDYQAQRPKINRKGSPNSLYGEDFKLYLKHVAEQRERLAGTSDDWGTAPW